LGFTGAVTVVDGAEQPAHAHKQLTHDTIPTETTLVTNRGMNAPIMHRQ
jgi:hypothetical protein